ncbi:AAA family ATPase [Botrimarina mediterranea]|uniref:AAA family ATPase n=1 Tax=Botrimarina mediterranea TaxID=2528022 RepID=UPI0036F483BF
MDSSVHSESIIDLLGSRIAVVGAPGAGKSTLAQRLAERLDAKHIDLDALHFLPGWRLRPEEDVRTDVGQAVAAERWVACGNWRNVRDLVWGRATSIVWLDYSLAVCFRRLLKRTVRRCWCGEEFHNGNREDFATQFFSRDSLLLYLLREHRRRREDIGSAIDDPAWRSLTVRRLKRPCELKLVLSQSK